MKPIGLCALGLMLFALSACADTTRPLLPLPTGPARPALVQPADPDRFTFVVSGDNRAAGRNLPMPPTAGQIFAELRLLQPAFVLWTGDTIYGSDDTVEEAGAEYTDFLRQAAQAETPIFNAPGNHEIFLRQDLSDLYEARMGRLYGSFDYGHTHVIALDTEELGRKPGIGKAQLDWLKQDLAANKKAKNIFVFSHHPLFPKEEKSGFSDAAERDELHQLFVQSGVKHVFSGHEHLYYKSVHDGVTYWVSGGGGAPADDATEEGGFQHYVLLTVEGDQVSAAVLQPWRLFALLDPKTPGTGTLINYNHIPLTLSLELPAAAKASVATAASTYKGKTVPLVAEIVPSRAPGMITVRVTVPKNRAARVTLGTRSAAR